jgi:hypothetical protein
MEIKVLSYSKTLPDFLKNSAMFYAKELGILNSKYNVVIVTDPSLKKDGNNGLCAKTGDREITIGLYSRLNIVKMLYTLAHEMVHVKQMARGQYRHETKRGSVHHYWMGKRVNASYIDRPWEREAFSRESILVETLSAHVSKKLKNKNKKR